MRIFPKIRIKLPRHPPKVTAASPASRRRSSGRAESAVRLLDLSSAVRGASSVESLYESLVDAVARAFSIPAISLFIRDDDTGDFSCRISTAVPHDAVSGNHAQLTLSADSFVIRRLKSLSSPLQLDAAELSAWQLALTDAPREVMEKRMRERDVLLQTRSSLLVQLRTKGDLLGVLALAKRESDRFTPEQREMLDSVAGQLALVIENTKLLQRLVEHERLRAELTVAAEVQRNLLPPTGLKLAGVDLCGFCQPASQVGGDYFDYVPLGDERVGICIADVAGKGISAALMMSVVQASLRGQLLNTQKHVPVKNVVAMLNRLICGSVTTARYVTCFYGQLEAADGSFRFVNAGHNPPLLLRWSAPQAKDPDAVFESLSCGGLVLGLFPDGNFEEGEVQLNSGDIFVAYTDGVTEAMNVQEEEFSEERLRAAIAEASDQSAKEILNHIIASVSQWSKGAPQHDDITVVVLKMD